MRDATALLVLALACGPEGAVPPDSARPQNDEGPRAAAAVVPGSGPRPTVLIVGGDVILSEAVRDYVHAADDPATRFGDEVLGPAQALWARERGAFVLVNLETPVADRRRHALDPHRGSHTGPGPRRVHFQAPGWLLPALRRAGVHGVTLANNHALDQGPGGLAETARNARRAGLAVVGAGRDGRRWPLRLGDEGNVIAVHAFFDGFFPARSVPSERTGPARLDDAAVEALRASRDRGDRPVAVVHVLGELVDAPEERWRRWAEELAAAGAEAIVVHGTHVVLPVERLPSGVPILWGLGNLFTDMGRESTPRREGGSKAAHGALRAGLIARLEARPGEPLALRFAGVMTYDERFARWHQGRSFPTGHAAFRLLPLTPCTPAATLPRPFPEALRAETETWIAARRDHLTQVAGLRPPPEGCGRWMRAAALSSGPPGGRRFRP